MVWIVIALALLVLLMGVKLLLLQDRHDTEKVAHAFASAEYDAEINELIGRIDEITYGTHAYELDEANRQLSKAQSDIEAVHQGWDEMQDSYEQDRLSFMENLAALTAENKAQAETIAQWVAKWVDGG